jgi:hypothetical protein
MCGESHDYGCDDPPFPLTARRILPMPLESRATGASESPDGTDGTDTSTSTGAGSIAWAESLAAVRRATGVVAPIEVTT